MTRIAVVLIVMAGLGGWLTPSAAQKALRTPSFRAVSDVYGTPNLFRRSVSIRVRLARGPAVDNRALFVVPATAPSRASWSTTHLTELPTRVSWTRSHTALASAFSNPVSTHPAANQNEDQDDDLRQKRDRPPARAGRAHDQTSVA